MPGSMPIRPVMPPICCICTSCSRRSERSNAPLRIFSATRAAFSASMVAAAFSTRVMMSPMPRMRSAMRAGWKSSSASIFSPVPMSLIGLPVTARMESAAPPRPSPSTRVRTIPVRPTRSSKARARLTASWPVNASATSSTSCGLAARLTSAASAIIASSSVVRPAVWRMTMSYPPSLQCTLGNLRRGLAGDDRQRLDVHLLSEHGKLLHRRRTAHIERSHEHLAPRLLGQPPGEFGGGGGLAGALQADHHDRHGRRSIEIDRLAPRAEDIDHLVVHDLHHHLAGRDRFDDFDPDCVALHLVDEGARHIERDVGFEQRA